MNRLFLLTGTTLLAILPARITAEGKAGQFDKPLSANDQILHALNRLTFGPRPGDFQEVRSLGLNKWIEGQLNPQRIPENRVLEELLKPLETTRLSAEEILKNYPQVLPGLIFRPMPLNEIISQDQVRRVQQGTAEERRAVIESLTPEKRKQVLGIIAPNLLASTPDLQKEAEAARKEQNEARTKELRKLMPQLNDLLTQDQLSTAFRGNSEQLKELFAYLDPEKRKQVAGALPAQAMAAFPELRREGLKIRQPYQLLIDDARQAKVYRAVYSSHQLEEVLTDFWFNHFNVFEGKQGVRPLLSSYERDAIRPHVLGKFKDLLLATAKHPAMLYYLDNWESIAPGIFEVGPFAGPAGALVQQLSRQAKGLNENYGREVMELHTLGVDAGYTQQDVIEVAKCFTGWTIRYPNTKPEFFFAGFMHDTNEKTVLGHKIAAGRGIEDGLEVIDILSRHPATARYISKKLAQRFVADDPPKSLIDKMAQTFTKTDGDLKAVLETMFTSREFLSEGAAQAKVKSPFEWIVSALRALQADTTDTAALAQKISDLGEPLYAKIEPTGYPATSDAWLSTASLLGRLNFSSALVSGQVTGVKLDGRRFDGEDPSAIARDVLFREPSPETQEAFRLATDGKQPTGRYLAGLALSSPDFQRR